MYLHDNMDVHVHVYVHLFCLFLQNQTHLQLNSDIIHSIKRGVEFSRMLQLPDSVAFNSDHMADILTAEGAVRPFKQIRLVI